MRLADYCRPTVSYVLNAMDLSVLTGYEHEAWELGDYVRVEDKDLGLSVTTRIVRREYNLQEPWNTVLELSTVLKNLGSSTSKWDNAADSLEGVSVVSSEDIAELVPFNLLRNSRAISEILHIGLPAVDAGKGHSIRTDGIQPRDKPCGVHRPLNVLHVLPVHEQGVLQPCLFRPEGRESL